MKHCYFFYKGKLPKNQKDTIYDAANLASSCSRISVHLFDDVVLERLEPGPALFCFGANAYPIITLNDFDGLFRENHTGIFIVKTDIKWEKIKFKYAYRMVKEKVTYFGEKELKVSDQTKSNVGADPYETNRGYAREYQCKRTVAVANEYGVERTQNERKKNRVKTKAPSRRTIKTSIIKTLVYALFSCLLTFYLQYGKVFPCPVTGTIFDVLISLSIISVAWVGIYLAEEFITIDTKANLMIRVVFEVVKACIILFFAPYIIYTCF